jgi:hypothetical protein
MASGLSGRPDSHVRGSASAVRNAMVDDPLDGRIRPWELAEPDRVDELRLEMGLDPMHPIPEHGPELPAEQQRAIYENQRWWENWPLPEGWRL